MVKRHSLFISAALFVFGLIPAHTAHAQSGDLFYDKHWIYNRPSVPSDQQRGSDMFPAVPLMYHQNADMLSSLSKTNTFGREDMLPNGPIPRQRPYYVLTMDPEQGPYKSR